MLWIARDKDGSLYLYGFEPTKHYDKWYDWDNGSFYDIIELDKNDYKEVTWENSPIPVKLLIEPKFTWSKLQQVKLTQEEYKYFNEQEAL